MKQTTECEDDLLSYERESLNSLGYNDNKVSPVHTPLYITIRCTVKQCNKSPLCQFIIM